MNKLRFLFAFYIVLFILTLTPILGIFFIGFGERELFNRNLGDMLYGACLISTLIAVIFTNRQIKSDSKPQLIKKILIFSPLAIYSATLILLIMHDAGVF